MFERILIANRGEIAIRIIRTAKRLGIHTTAVYSEADHDAPHVAAADNAICIGPAPALESYLSIPNIIDAALLAKAQAIHPGYGFLSENPDFAKACQKNGITFIGPGIDAIHIMGSKSLAKQAAIDAGVTVIPGYKGSDQSAEHLLKQANSIGYPLMIKATMGGGGKGMRLVRHQDEFKSSLESCQREAAAAFGSAEVLLEKYIESPRHIEVQVFGDTHGNYVHIFERDCSLQRRHQKIIEEAPAFDISDKVREDLGEAAIKLARSVQYCGAGTVEFLYDKSGAFYFMEMNTRLQVEHPVTEEITGLDLVEWQLRVAAGDKLPLTQKDIKFSGHSVELRIYAEDPANNFLPSTGKILLLGEIDKDTRLEIGIKEGSQISSYYDPMIAKVIVKGKTRKEALQKAYDAINGWPILGVKTNIDFLQSLLKDKDVIKGNIDVSFIDQNMDRWKSDSKDLNLIHRLAALGMHLLNTPENSPWTLHDSWRMGSAEFETYEITSDKASTPVQIQKVKDGEYLLDGKSIKATLKGHLMSISYDRTSIDAYVVKNSANSIYLWTKGHGTQVKFKDPLETDKKQSDMEIHVKAPMTSKVIAINVRKGEAVASGQPLVIVEAMKMEHVIKAPKDGTIGNIYYKIGDIVQEGVDLLDFDGGNSGKPMAKAS